MTARCPICTAELEDVNAVRRHTLVDHGVTTPEEAGPAGGWTSVTGPGSTPAWHADPWNASGLRWWDGTQWTGQTAPIGSVPASPAGAAKPGRLQALRIGGPGRPPAQVMLVGVLVVVAVVAVAAVALSSHPATKRVVAGPAATLPPVPSTAPAAAPAGLAEGVLTPSDVGGGWTASSAPAAMAQHDYTSGPCSSPLWAHDVAGEDTTLVDGGGGIIQSHEVDSSVVEAPSADAAAGQAAFVTSPSFETCAKDEVIANVQGGLAGSPAQLGQVSVDPLTLNIPATSVGYVFDVGIVDPALGLGSYINDDHVELFVGPYEGSLDVVANSQNPLPGDLVQQLAARLAERLAALPAGGTLHASAA